MSEGEKLATSSFSVLIYLPLQLFKQKNGIRVQYTFSLCLLNEDGARSFRMAALILSVFVGCRVPASLFTNCTHSFFSFSHDVPTDLIPAIIFIKMGKSTLTGIARLFHSSKKKRERERRIGLGDELSSSELAYDVGVRFICYVCAIIAGMIDPSRMSVQLGDVMNRPRQRRRRRRLV